MTAEVREYCGVFGIFGHPRAAQLTYYGLLALQHRGQEGAGIAVANEGRLHAHKGVGLTADVFNESLLDKLSGDAAIGQTLYLRRGMIAADAELQPLFVRHRQGELAFCYNGALTNAEALRHRLEDDGSIFHTRVDIEVVAHLMARHHRQALPDALRSSLALIQGGYAGVWLTPGTLLAARDPHGIRPLCLGKIEWMSGGDPVLAGARRTAWVVASESCALDTVGAEFVRDIAPGEMLVIDDQGVRGEIFGDGRQPRLCAFEYVYFARPDSNLNDRNVHIVRKRLGRELAREQPVQADVVIGVPDSSLAAASGYAEEVGLPYEVGLIKNRYIGRTFIKPTKKAREEGVLVNLNAVRQVVDGKRVVLVDDSVVRGTTSRRLVELVRGAGAKEVHMRISSPPFRHACPYGIDAADEGELVASGRTDDEIEAYVGADSLKFLTVEGMLRAIGNTGPLDAQLTGTYDRDGRAVQLGSPSDSREADDRDEDRDGPGDASSGEFCLACFTGCYAVPLAGVGEPVDDGGGLEAGRVPSVVTEVDR